MKEVLDYSFPRILVLNSQSINKNNATGITLRSVLSCIPKDKLLQVYRFNPWNPVPEKMDIDSVQIPPKAMPISYIFKRTLGAVTDEDRKPIFDQKEQKSETKQKPYKVALKAALDNSIILPNKSFLERIDSFNPEFIYTLGGGICIQKWALYFAKRYNCRVVTHYMDNWRQTAYSDNGYLTFINRYLNKQLDLLEKRMKYGMVISDAMAEAYRDLYHHEYLPLMNTVDKMVVEDKKHDYLTIVYAGGLHLNRYKTLLEVEKSIRAFPNARLNIFTSKENIHAYRDLFDKNVTTFKMAVDHSEIVKVYECADILLHIESFERDDIEYTKYSLSTKIPEYMMSGKPIICYAPSSIAASQYISSSGAGISVSSSDEFINAVRLLSEKKTRDIYGKNGVNTAINNHSKESTIQVLKRVFALGE